MTEDEAAADARQPPRAGAEDSSQAEPASSAPFRGDTPAFATAERDEDCFLLGLSFFGDGCVSGYWPECLFSATDPLGLARECDGLVSAWARVRSQVQGKALEQGDHFAAILEERSRLLLSLDDSPASNEVPRPPERAQPAIQQEARRLLDRQLALNEARMVATWDGFVNLCGTSRVPGPHYRRWGP